VYLTDLLWDVNVGEAVYCNMALQAPPGIIVVSNRPASSKALNMGYVQVDTDISVPVSWIDKQQFFFYMLTKDGPAATSCHRGGLHVQCNQTELAIGGKVSMSVQCNFVLTVLLAGVL